MLVDPKPKIESPSSTLENESERMIRVSITSSSQVKSNEVKIPISKAKYSEYWRNILEEFTEDQLNFDSFKIDSTATTMINVSKLLSALPPYENKDSDRFEPEDDSDFYKDMTIQEIFDLTMASNFLGIKPLVYSCTRHIATLVKKTPVDEMNDLFNGVRRS